MKLQFKETILAMLKTLAILILFEIVSTAVVPLFGISSIRIPFNILVILYLGFKLESPVLAILILIIQYFHSFFTVEGWELGTIAGILVCIVVSYLKDMIHLTSFAITMLVTELFQVLWFLIVSMLLYIRLEDTHLIVSKFWRFIPESLIISLVAPLCFTWLDKFWKTGDKGLLGEN